MITLCMDTSHKFLTLVLIEDHKIIASINEECFKQQSEMIFIKLNELVQQAKIKVSDIDQVCVTKGPGSYTGVRIAMTVAKVMATVKHLPLYTLDSLQLYSGNDDVCVVVDARSNRCYFAKYQQGVLQGKIIVDINDDLKELIGQDICYGDASLIGQKDYYPDLAKAFLALKDQWTLVEKPHLLAPNYLKPSTDYLVK